MDLDSILALDRKVFFLVNHGMSSSILNPIFIALSHPISWSVGMTLWLAYALKTKNWQVIRVGVGILLAVGLADLICAYGLKPWIARPRPCQALADVYVVFGNCNGQFGFPSNHTANVSSAAAFMASVWTKYAGYFWLAAFLVGLSRVYLGYHYPGDVIGGAVIGAGVGWILTRVARKLPSRFRLA